MNFRIVIGGVQQYMEFLNLSLNLFLGFHYAMIQNWQVFLFSTRKPPLKTTLKSGVDPFEAKYIYKNQHEAIIM